jgi:hypothetical protein
MVFEDAHWIDPTSLEALGYALSRIRSLPCLWNAHLSARPTASLNLWVHALLGYAWFVHFRLHSSSNSRSRAAYSVAMRARWSWAMAAAPARRPRPCVAACAFAGLVQARLSSSHNTTSMPDRRPTRGRIRAGQIARYGNIRASMAVSCHLRLIRDEGELICHAA